MRRVLAITVGGEPDPVVQAVRQHAPDFVIFFVTTEPAGGSRRFLLEDTEKGEAILKRTGLSGEAYEVIPLPNPDDFGDCFRRIHEALREHPAAGERLADYTGGTKTMTAALATAALLLGWSLSVVVGARRDTVKVAKGTELARRVGLAPVQQELVLLQVRALYRSHEFAAAAALLQDLLGRAELPGREQERLTRLCTFLRALAAWDRFAYAEAQELLRPVGEVWPQGCALLAQIWRQGALDFGAVADLVGNALRRAEQGRYEDAVLRLYRAVELLAQLRLRSAHGLSSEDLDLTRLPADLAAPLAARREREGRAWVGLVEAYGVLAALDDPLGRVYQAAWTQRLKDLLAQRNRLLLAHGLSPIGPADWERSRTLALAFLREAHAALGRPFQPVAFPRAEEVF